VNARVNAFLQRFERPPQPDQEPAAEAAQGYQLEKDDADSGDDPDSGPNDKEELDNYYHGP